MSKLNISVSPHIKSKTTTQRIMLDVVIALLPAQIASSYFFGMRAYLVALACVLTCVIGELALQLICKREIAIYDLSAVVTGMLLAFNLPVTIPIWQAVIGSLFAIVVVKGLFGGIGHNFANPAATARIMLFISFSASMSSWVRPVDLTTSATPLATLKAGSTIGLPSLLDMFIGNRAGCLGETCAVALIAGGIYLIVRRVITWHAPVAFIGSVFVLSLIMSGGNLTYSLYEVLSGGLILGAFFMATDYSTTPPTPLGKFVFGLGCGIITMVIRRYGSYNEGVSFAILLMNILTPYISNFTAHRVFGARYEKKAKGAKA